MTEYLHDGWVCTHAELVRWLESRRRDQRYPVPVFRVALDGRISHGVDTARLDMDRFRLVRVHAYSDTDGLTRSGLIAVVGLDTDGDPLIGSLTEALIVALPMDKKG